MEISISVGTLHDHLHWSQLQQPDNYPSRVFTSNNDNFISILRGSLLGLEHNM